MFDPSLLCGWRDAVDYHVRVLATGASLAQVVLVIPGGTPGDLVGDKAFGKRHLVIRRKVKSW